MRIFELKSIWADVGSESETLAANLAFTVDSFKIRETSGKRALSILTYITLAVIKLIFCNILKDFFILDFVH